MSSGYPNITLAHTNVAVATSTTQVLAENLNRTYVLIQNTSAADAVFVSFGVPAVANAGIKIDAGGAMEMGARYGNLDTRAVNAIHAGTGSQPLLVTEG